MKKQDLTNRFIEYGWELDTVEWQGTILVATFTKGAIRRVLKLGRVDVSRIIRGAREDAQFTAARTARNLESLRGEIK